MGVTIKDVAAAAGVSVSTVSKVINSHYSISQETADHVWQVIRELNYYPNASAQSFARGATRTVAALVDLSANMAFQNPHLFEILSGLEETLSGRNYQLMLKGVDADSSYEIAEEIISRRRADALAIHVSVLTHPLSGLLTRLHFPHIVLGVPAFESQVCWIDNNNVYSGTVAASYLLSCGYSRVAFVGGKYYDMGSTLRLQGLRQGLLEAGVTMDEQNIHMGDSTREDGYRMGKKLTGSSPMPDVVVCANSYIAMGCAAAIRDAGLTIPEDMGVLSFDDYPLSRMTDPPLTVVDINVRCIGIQAGKFLLNMIRQPNMQVQTYLTTSDLIVRQSTRKQRHFP